MLIDHWPSKLRKSHKSSVWYLETLTAAVSLLNVDMVINVGVFVSAILLPHDSSSPSVLRSSCSRSLARRMPWLLRVSRYRILTPTPTSSTFFERTISINNELNIVTSLVTALFEAGCCAKRELASCYCNAGSRRGLLTRTKS
jgi:hypothetical protein